MSNRQVLLIDRDDEFHDFLTDVLAPHGFVITVADENDNPLGLVPQLAPALIFIAVEKPDKVGYSLCNKAKKGLARDIPVILTTRTEPPAGFKSHRKLKVHADEYIDKRTMTRDELLEKVAALIGLGAGAVVTRDGSVDVEELALDDIDVALEDDVIEEFEAPPSTRVNRAIEELSELGGPTMSRPAATVTSEDVDAAISVLGEDEAAPAATEDFDAESEAVYDVIEDADPDALSERTFVAPSNATMPLAALGGAAMFGAEREETSDLEALPSDATGVEGTAIEDALEAGRDGRDTGAPELDPIADSLDAAPVAELSVTDFLVDEGSLVGAEVAADLAAESAVVVPVVDVEPAVEVEPAIEVESAAEGHDEAVALESAAESIVAASATPAALAPAAPVVAPVIAAAVEPAAIADGRYDLGLDQVASQAATDRARPAEQRAAERTAELERELARTSAELEDARRGAGAAFSREREFLSLREVINRKEKEVLDLRDEIGTKDRELLAGRAEVRGLERERAELDSKLLATEQRLLAESEKLEAERGRSTELGVARAHLERDLTATRTELETHRGRVASLEQELDGTLKRTARERHELETTHAATLADRERELSQDRSVALAAAEDRRTHELAAAEDRRTRELAAAEDRRTRELAEASTAAATEQADKLAARDAATAQALADAKAAAEADSATVERDHAAALAELTIKGERARQSLEDLHAGQLLRVQRQSSDTVAKLEAEHAEALAAADQRRVSELIAAEDQRQNDLAAAEDRRKQDLAEADERRRSELAEAEQLKVRELVAADERKKLALAAAAEERAASENRLQEKYEAARTALVDEHAEAVGRLEERVAAGEAQLASAGQRIRELEDGLTTARQHGEAQARQIASLEEAASEREDRLAALRRELGELEQQNSAYQEQVLKAYQRIKADETTVSRAKKALAIALTLLDEAAVEQLARAEDSKSS